MSTRLPTTAMTSNYHRRNPLPTPLVAASAIKRRRAKHTRLYTHARHNTGGTHAHVHTSTSRYSSIRHHVRSGIAAVRSEEQSSGLRVQTAHLFCTQDGQRRLQRTPLPPLQRQRRVRHQHGNRLHVHEVGAELQRPGRVLQRRLVSDGRAIDVTARVDDAVDEQLQQGRWTAEGGPPPAAGVCASQQQV